MPVPSFRETNKITRTEQLWLNLRKGHVKGVMNAVKFVDKDTKQNVVYLPSFDLSGYGESIEKANAILRFAVEDFFKHLLSFPQDQIQIELARYGFKRSMFHKEYSKSYIDRNGELNGFNAEDDKVEHVTLIAA